MKYRTKPDLVEAFRFDADVEMNAPAWFGQMVKDETIYIDRIIEDGAIRVYGCTIKTPAGRLQTKTGDYIILEKTGAVRCLKSAQFRQQYEKVRT